MADWNPVIKGLKLSTIALAIATAAACGAHTRGSLPPGTTEPDKFLFDKGTEALNAKKWLTAREFFKQVTETYTASPYRPDAKVGIGDTYLGEATAEALVLAINEYREFLSYYPTHRRADYAQLKLGMSYYYQMHGPDRDQSETNEAIVELTHFVEQYPNSPLIGEAQKRLRDARDRKSDADFRVGYFYLRTQKFPPAAVDRFNAILKADPEYTRRDAVYFYLAQALNKMKREAEALPYLDRLVKEFEYSEYLEEAKKLAETLKADMNKPKNGSLSHDS
jgi:outer membrane protein assembly factor BamD